MREKDIVKVDSTLFKFLVNKKWQDKCRARKNAGFLKTAIKMVAHRP
jgi:hypothetical protein